jgi:predicted unusual protein kinase regulating ubiquinone biosynthesis (AarF/ABC1/UbiB family)
MLRRRRFRIMLFFARVAIHFLWWDFFLRLSPLRIFRTPWIPRWQKLTRKYKAAALDAQGLWIKLGQFLSTRVDVLPMQITQELESLRDEIPPVSEAVIVDQIEAGLGCAVQDVFSSIAPQPIGSASLAQVHRAQTITGEAVVVKVLRPGIQEMIGSDMELLRKMSRWLKSAKPIARRADIDALVTEFDTVTTRELDLRSEAQNSERFAEDFAADPGLATPRIYQDLSSSSILTMEDVSYIRIDDVAALHEAGIDRKAVARKIYDVFLTQFFLTYRVHADPHPGNIFVRPLPTLEEITDHPVSWSGFKPGSNVPYAEKRPFQLVFVDFGMVVEMPPSLREGLREFAIGLGTRDARRILDSYSKLGVLRRGANLDGLEEMLQAQLDNFWGTFIGQMRVSDFSRPEAQEFLQQYEGLMAAAPFQFRTEMLFVTRAMGILSGVTYHLDPEFDAWNETAPFAQRLVREDVTKAVLRSVQDLAAGRAPSSLGTIFRLLPTNRFTRPRPVVVDSRNAEELRRLRKSVNRLRSLVGAGALLAIGVVLKGKDVQVSNLMSWLWPGNDLGQWTIEIACILLIFILVRRGS